MKRIAICEDNEIEAELLRELLVAYFRRFGIKAEIFIYYSGEALVADVEENFMDAELIFLDIYMDKLNGMETARKLRELHCDSEIIFLTATTKYAIESYDVNAAGYLLKPIDMDRIAQILDRIFYREVHRRIGSRAAGSFAIHISVKSYISTVRDTMSCFICLTVAPFRRYRKSASYRKYWMMTDSYTVTRVIS